MEKRSIEVTIEAVEIPMLGVRMPKRSSHLVSADLLWPRMGIARKSGEQGCTLQSGVADCSKVLWGRKILLRENIEGRCALRIRISEDLEDEALEKLLRFCGGVFLGVAAETVEDLVPLGKIASAPLSYASKEVAKYNGPETIVEGFLELEAADFQKTGSRRMVMQLFAAQDVTVSKRKKIGNGKQSRTVHSTLLKKGEPNGTITLLVTTV